MPQTETIREFLVALGWRNDANSEKRFISAIEGATLRANVLATSIESMASKITTAMSSLGEQGNTIYRLMEITHASSGTILGMRNAFQQLGLGAGAADAFLIKVTQSLNRYNDSNAWFYKQIGFSKSASGELLLNVKQGHEALSKMEKFTVQQYADVTGADVNFLMFLRDHSDEVEQYITATSQSMKAFGIKDDDFKKQQELYTRISNIWQDLGSAWKRLGTDLGVSVTPKLDELSDWMKKNPDAVAAIEAFSVAIGGLGAAGIATRTAGRLLGIGGRSVGAGAEIKAAGALGTAGGALQTAAGELSASAGALNEAALALGGKGAGTGVAPLIGKGGAGGPGRSPSGPAAGAGLLSWFGSGAGAMWLGILGAGSLLFGEASGQKGASEMLRRRREEASDAETKAWANSEARRLQYEQMREVGPENVGNLVAREPPHRPVTPTPTRSWWRKIFGAADIPTEQAQAASFETQSRGGFRIPGSGEEIGFGMGKETALTVGGSPVQPGNPLPVRIEKIDPMAGGFGGEGATGAGVGQGGRAGLFDYARRHGAEWTGVGNKGIGGWWTPERMKYASDYLMEHAGLSKQGAAGLVARWAAVEAPGGPTSVNPISGAAGIAQGLGDRRAGYTGSFEEQLANAARELRTTEKAAGDALRAAQTPFEAARGASMFERAEGYNRQSGTDYFTMATPVEKTLEAINKARASSSKEAFSKQRLDQGAFDAPGTKFTAPKAWDPDQFRSPLMRHYDQSDNSITHNNNQHVTVNVTGVSDPSEAGRAVGSSLAQIFPEAKSATRHLTPALT